MSRSRIRLLNASLNTSCNARSSFVNSLGLIRSTPSTYQVASARQAQNAKNPARWPGSLDDRVGRRSEDDTVSRHVRASSEPRLDGFSPAAGPPITRDNRLGRRITPAVRHRSNGLTSAEVVDLSQSNSSTGRSRTRGRDGGPSNSSLRLLEIMNSKEPRTTEATTTV